MQKVNFLFNLVMRSILCCVFIPCSGLYAQSDSLEKVVKVVHEKANTVVLFFNATPDLRWKVNLSYSPFLPANQTVDTAFMVAGESSVSLLLDRPQLVTLAIDSNRFAVYLVPKDTLYLAMDDGHLMFSGKGARMNIYFQDKKKALGFEYATEHTFMLGSGKSSLTEAIALIDLDQERELSFLKKMEGGLPAWFVHKERELITIQAQAAKFMYAGAKQVPYAKLVAADSSLRHFVVQPENVWNLKERNFYNLLCYAYFKKAADVEKEPYILRYRKVLKAMQADGVPPEVLELFNTYWLSFMIPYTGNIMALNDYQLLWNELRPGFRTISNEVLINGLLKRKMEVLQGPNGLQLGSVAPVFDAVDTAGSRVSLADLKGKWVYVDLWATWCVPCLQGLDVKRSLGFEKWAKDLVVLNVCVQSKRADWLAYVKKKKPGGLNCFADADLTAKLVAAYQVFGFPHYVLIRPDGNIYENQTADPVRMKALFVNLLTSR